MFLLILLFPLSVLGQSLDSSIMIFNDYDLSICIQQVSRAQQIGAKKINFIPTFYTKLNKKSVTSFHFKDKNAKSYALNKSNLTKMSSEFKKCMSYARDLNIAVILTPHIDDLDNKLWRFYFNFNPLKKYQGISYEDIILTLDTDFEIKYFISAELEEMYFNFHKEMFEISLKLKNKNGINFNYNRNRRAPLYSYDFVGVSNYSALPLKISHSIFREQLKKLRKELSKVKMHKLPLYYNEIGLGGRGDEFTFPLKPHEGIYGAFNDIKNPWRNIFKENYRKKYFKSLLDFLEGNKIEGVFIWNLDSFDVQGLYPYT